MLQVSSQVGVINLNFMEAWLFKINLIFTLLFLEKGYYIFIFTTNTDVSKNRC